MNALKCWMLVLVLSCCGNVLADINKANQLYLQKDYPSALKAYLPLAKEGESYAQQQLGIMYTFGFGTPANANEAFMWFEKAKSQGKPEAQYWYGMSILNGNGTPKSPEKSIQWFEKSANQGNADAQNTLGILHMVGLGTKVDYKESFKWNTKAAIAGKAEAMYNLGQLYEKGTGANQSAVKAVYWYEQAAKQGFTMAEFELGVAYAQGLAGYIKDIDKAIFWYKKAASKNNTHAQANLGTIYLDQYNKDPKKLAEAISWFTKAAELGEMQSQLVLATAYINGDGVNRNPLTGLNWMRKSAAAGYEPAIKSLQEMEAKRKLTVKTVASHYFERASKWQEKTLAELEAANANDGEQQEKLAIAYHYGLLNSAVNKLKAVEAYLNVMRLQPTESNLTSQKNLASIYIDGLTAVDDAVEAKLKIDQMAQAGDAATMRFLARFYTNYYDGYGHNAKLAKFWYEKLAQTGDKPAQLALARSYQSTYPNQTDPESKADYKQALYWFKKAATDETPYAQYELAKVYISGRGGEKNNEEAMKLLKKAAGKGVLDAKIALAEAYQKGEITAQDNTKAMMLFEEIALENCGTSSKGFTDSATKIGQLHELNANKIQSYVWYSLVLEARDGKTICPSNSSPTTAIGGKHILFGNEHFLNLEQDSSGWIYMVGYGEGYFEKRNKQEKANLNNIEKSLNAEDLKLAKKALADWKNLHSK